MPNNDYYILATEGRNWAVTITEKKDRIDFNFEIFLTGVWPRESVIQFVRWILGITEPYREEKRPLTCNLPDRIAKQLGLNNIPIHGVDWVFKMEKKGKLCTE